jgi:predicted transposase YbfD/YdcC
MPGRFRARRARWAPIHQLGVNARPSILRHVGELHLLGVSAPRVLQALDGAWANKQCLVLAQEALDEKANEITALPLLLERLDLTDQIVTIDAIGCQRAIATQIVDGGGDYVLAVKATRPRCLTMSGTASRWPRPVTGMHRTVEKGRGRLETRVCRTIADPAVIAWLDPNGVWTGVRSIAMVEATRRVTGTDTPTLLERYSISSLPGAARQIGCAVRSHWGIENRLHWVLDMAFREDESRVRLGHSADNLAMLRKLALQLI